MFDRFNDECGFGLFKMMSAAMTPGIQPKSVRIITISTEPQPLSKTESGGNITAKITRQTLICLQSYN